MKLHEPEELFPAITVRLNVSWGRPFVHLHGVSTAVIYGRCIEAGEVARDVATDYGMAFAEVLQAIGYECFLRRTGRRRPSKMEREVAAEYKKRRES